MALNENQINRVIDYANTQVQQLVTNSDIDIYNDKDIQRFYVALSRLYKQLNTTMAQQLPTTVYQTYLDGLKTAEQALERAGLGAIVSGSDGFMNMAEAPLHVEAIHNIVSDMLGDLSAGIRTAEHYGSQTFDDCIDEVKDEIANGYVTGLTTKQITQRVGEKFGKHGMTSFITKDGKHLPLDFYAKTVVRTKLQTAENHAHLNRYEERKVKHVLVTGNVPTCAECAPYRNIVFSTSRDDPDFPYIDLHHTFPKHPNCRCNFRPWISKFKDDEEIEREKEKARQFDADKDVRSENEAKKYDAQQKAKAKARRQRLAYNKIKSRLGNDGPQSFKHFKSASKKQYHDWVAQMNKMYNPDKSVILKDKDKAEKQHHDSIKDDKPPREQPKPKTQEQPKQVEETPQTDYTTPSDFDEVHNEKAERLFRMLNDDARDAFRNYAGDDYSLINEYQRRLTLGMSYEDQVERDADTEFARDMADDMERAFNDLDFRLEQSATLYRGAKDAEANHIINNIEEDENGELYYTTESFKSTSSNKDAADDFADGQWHIEFRVPKNANIVSMQTISDYTDEREFLIRNGMTCRVVDIDEFNFNIVLEVLPEE